MQNLKLGRNKQNWRVESGSEGITKGITIKTVEKKDCFISLLAFLGNHTIPKILKFQTCFC